MMIGRAIRGLYVDLYMRLYDPFHVDTPSLPPTQRTEDNTLTVVCFHILRSLPDENHISVPREW